VPETGPSTRPAAAREPQAPRSSDRAPDGFRALFESTFADARSSASRIIGNREDAEDLAAEAFARAFANWDRIDRSRAAGWVVRTTINLAIDRARRSRLALLVPADALASDGSDPARRVDISRAMRSLPRRQREVIGLLFFADLSEAEVADALGLHLGTVKVHRRRALEKLRAQVGPN